MERAKKELMDSIQRHQMEVDGLNKQLAVLKVQCDCRERDLTKQIESLEGKLSKEREHGQVSLWWGKIPPVTFDSTGFSTIITVYFAIKPIGQLHLRKGNFKIFRIFSRLY